MYISKEGRVFMTTQVKAVQVFFNHSNCES